MYSTQEHIIGKSKIYIPDVFDIMLSRQEESPSSVIKQKKQEFDTKRKRSKGKRTDQTEI